jgi:hypothetical protein
MGAILGHKLAGHRLGLRTMNSFAVVAEILALVGALVIYAGVSLKNVEALYFAFALKGIALGFLPVLRATWLKQAEDEGPSKQILVVVTTMVQASYGLGGVLLLLNPSVDFARNVILADALSSALGAVLFATMRGGAVAPPPSGQQEVVSSWRLLRSGDRAQLALADILFAVAMGGINVFMVQQGNHFFGTSSGYGRALIVYSVGYLLGGFLMQKLVRAQNLREQRTMLALPVFYIIAVLSLAFVPNPQLGLTALLLSFVAYPMLIMGLDTLWFESLTKSQAAKFFSFRAVLIAGTWGLGELLYPQLSQVQGQLLRAACAAAGLWLLSRFLIRPGKT